MRQPEPRSAFVRVASALVGIASLGALCGCGVGSESAFVDELVRAEREGEDTPLLSEAEPGATLERAYAVQRAFVNRRFGAGKIGGYKAGLSTRSAQERFGASEPVAGVLPILGRLEGEPSLDVNAFRRLLVEIEFAFELGGDISSPIPDVAALREVVSALRPAVELPDIGFPRLEGLQMVDLIAANVASSYLLMGPPVDPDTVDLGALEVELSLDGEVLSHFDGAESELEPWEAIRWLVNDRLRRGWPLRAGQILIAGALAPPEPGTPGPYEADFGALGVLRFELTRPE